MVTVNELREELVDLGLTKDEANGIVGKSNLLKKLEELKVDRESEDLFNDENIQVEEDEGTVSESDDETTISDENPPDMTDPNWSDYVLSHLEESEKIKGHPKTDSLRRLTELLIGPVLSIDVEVPQSPNVDNGGRAVVIARIEVMSNLGLLKAAATADVFPGNTEMLYAKFASATADTRAEGRAYRKLLRLINVVTAEEVVDENEIYDPENKIADAQIMMINQMCSTAKLDIDIEKLLSRYDIEVAGLEKISKSKATQICKDISSYQETGVPDDLVGYKENWR